uniref:Uncharacterized protein n=1 Tax=Glossina pallidipes TaxID=7398 RepID=A0A1A9ZNS9_GLOPL
MLSVCLKSSSFGLSERICDAHDAQSENPAGISAIKANSIGAMKSEYEKTLKGMQSPLSPDQTLASKFPKHGCCVILNTFRTTNRCYTKPDHKYRKKKMGYNKKSLKQIGGGSKEEEKNSKSISQSVVLADVNMLRCRMRSFAEDILS